MKLRTLAVATLAATLAACSQATGSAPPGPDQPYHAQPPGHRGGTLVISDWQFPDSFNMISATAETDLRVGALLFAPLWGLDSSLRPYPDLVREVPTLKNGDVRIGPGGKTMTVDVKLVPGLKWSDGQPITAADVIFTWQAICDPATNAASTAGFDHIHSMTEVSPTEVIWNFAPEPAGWCGNPQPLPDGVYAPYLQLGPQMWLVPKHRLQGVSHASWISNPYFGDPNVTSGPFTIGHIYPGDSITLNPNPHYQDGRSSKHAYTERSTSVRFTHAAYLSQLIYKVYGDKPTMIAALKADETDVGFNLAAEDVPALKGVSTSHTVVLGGLDQEFLNPNHGMNTATHRFPPWVTAAGQDTTLLQALSLAIDRKALVQKVMNGAARVSDSLYPSALTMYRDPDQHFLSYNLRAAERMLTSDGWLVGAGGVRVKDGRKLAFSLFTVCSNLQRAEELGVLKADWAAVGARVSTGCSPEGIFFASYSDGGINAVGAFDMTLFSNTWQPDPSSWAPVGMSSQIPSARNPDGDNWNRCRDPLLDQDFAAGEATLVPQQRQSAYLAAQREWLRYACTLPLFEWPEVTQVSNHLHNFAANPAISMDVWNSADWWVSQ